MRRLQVALWTLASSLLAVGGCANVLGFQDFSAGDGGVANGNNQSATSGGAATSTGTDPNPGGNQPTNGPSTALGTSSNGGVASTASSDPGTSNVNGGQSSNSAGTSISTGSNGASTSFSGPSIGGGTSSGGSNTVSSSTASRPNSGSSSSSNSSTTTSSSVNNNPPPACTFGTAHNGDGSFTWYYFGQGPMPYKGACGYTVSETGGGQNAVDTAANIANTSPATDTYFAAIPGASPGNFDTVTDCGACVEITGQNGKKIVATVIDECPLSSNPLCTNGHLDLSTQAFDQLGYSTGNPSGTSLKFVACPVAGNI